MLERDFSQYATNESKGNLSMRRLCLILATILGCSNAREPEILRISSREILPFHELTVTGENLGAQGAVTVVQGKTVVEAPILEWSADLIRITVPYVAYEGGAKVVLKSDSLSTSLAVNYPTFPHEFTAAEDFALGSFFACYLRAGQPWCFGENMYGLFGDVDNVKTPRLVKVSPRFSSLAAGISHICGLAADGVYCWGDNERQQLGAAFEPVELSPVQIVEGDWTKIAAGSDRTCAIKRDTSLICWGSDAHPYSSTPKPFSPTPITEPSSSWAEVAISDAGYCAKSTDDHVYCKWLDEPVIDMGVGWSEISSGRKDYCALKTNRSLWCWEEQFGERAIEVAQNVDSFAVSNHSVCFSAKAKLVCIYDGDEEVVYQVPNIQKWSRIKSTTLEQEIWCAEGDGTLYCWGVLRSWFFPLADRVLERARL